METKQTRTVSMGPTLWKQLDERAEDIDRSRSWVVRQLVEKYLGGDVELD